MPNRFSVKPIKEDKDYSKYHYSFNLHKVLIIRSHSPLMQELIEYVKREFPDCRVDILQVKGASVMECYGDPIVGDIYETESSKGFLLRELYKRHKFFDNKQYDAVFVLYGMPLGLARFYNVELFATMINARYYLGYDLEKNIKVITRRLFFFKTLDYLISNLVYFINILATVFLLIYTLFFMIILSPLKLLFKLFKKKSRQT